MLCEYMYKEIKKDCPDLTLLYTVPILILIASIVLPEVSDCDVIVGRFH